MYSIRKLAGLAAALLMSVSTVAAADLVINSDQSGVAPKAAERLGSKTMLHVTLADGESVVLKAAGTVLGRTGDAVTTHLSLKQSHIFGAHGLALRHPERPS